MAVSSSVLGRGRYSPWQPASVLTDPLHAKGFNTGGTNSSAYSGQFWSETEDVVFVNFKYVLFISLLYAKKTLPKLKFHSYRLNIFGFPGAPGVTQNLGLLDQRLALEWVYAICSQSITSHVH